MTIVSLNPGFGLQTVGDLGDMSGALPFLGLPSVPFTFETLRIIFPNGLSLVDGGSHRITFNITLNQRHD